jgi:hypothetical protein
MPALSSLRRQLAALPLPILLLSAAVAAAWAARLLAPLPEALPAAPLAMAPAPAAAASPAALWLNETAAAPAAVKVLALIGSPSGNGRAVLEVDGALVAGNTGESPLPDWRIVAVRPDAVDLEIDGKMRTLNQPLPAPGPEIAVSR